MKRILLCIMISVMLLCSCSLEALLTDKTPDDEPGKEGDEAITETGEKFLTLPVYINEELDPYRSGSRTNRDLLSLCYEGLVYLNNDKTAGSYVCESYETEENTVTLYLKQDVFFSDGTEFTAADCVYSFMRAAESDSVYRERFTVISGYKVIDDYTFRVSFKYTNIDNINMLTLPIIKAGSDLTGSYPCGFGQYRPIGSQNLLYLVPNAYYPDTENIAMTRINTVGITGLETLLYNINYGRVHAAYADLSDGAASYRGNIELVEFVSDRLVFAVVNRQKEYFTDINAVRGITYAIDRNGIIEKLLSDASVAVWYPFSPAWKRTVDAQLNPDIYSTKEAHDCFTQAGYTLSGTERRYNGRNVALTILVNQESPTKVSVAKSIANDLTELGFTVTVKALKWAEMTAAISEGKYDIFIGETDIFPNMEITSLTENKLIKGANEYSEEFLEALDGFYEGTVDMRTFMSVFMQTLPVIPLYYSGGALAVNRNVNGEFKPSYYDLFEGIGDWTLE